MGTPFDYSESVYRFYLEVADCRAATRRLIEEFLPQHHAAGIVDLDYVFEPEMPIQCAPDLDSQASVEREHCDLPARPTYKDQGALEKPLSLISTPILLSRIAFLAGT